LRPALLAVLITNGQRILIKGRITRYEDCMITSAACRYSRLNDQFCCIHQCGDCQCFSMGWSTPKNCPFPWGGRSRPPSNTWFLGPTQVSPSNRISIGSAVFTARRYASTVYAVIVCLSSVRLSVCDR